MKLSKEDKAFLDLFSAEARAMGFDGVDLAKFASQYPEPKDYTGLTVDIRNDDGTIETLTLGK